MRAVVTGDTHLAVSGRYFGLDGERLDRHRETFYREFDRVVEYALDTEPDLFVHCGDLFDVCDPDPAALAPVIDRVRDLERAGIESVFVTGNHDWSRVVDGEERSDPDALTPLHVLEAADVGTVFTDIDPAAATFDVGDRRIRAVGVGYDPTIEGETDPSPVSRSRPVT